MVLVIEEEQITLKLITTLHEGRMLVPPSLSQSGGGIRRGRGHLPYRSFFGVICLYAMMIT